MRFVPIVEALGLADAVLFPDHYKVGLGYEPDFMADLYRSFDVLLSPSMGEGFGVPIVEAQACGCPVIVGDWTAMSELCFAGWKIDRSEAERFWVPSEAWMFLPHVGAIEDRMEAAIKGAGGTGLQERAVEGASAYFVDRVMEEHWWPLLADMERRIGIENNAPPALTKKARLLKRLAAGMKELSSIVEIGCVRRTEPDEHDGFATIALAEVARDHNGQLTTVDRSPIACALARALLEQAGLESHAVVREGDGASALKDHSAAIDLLYLDGGDDPQLTLAQFQAALPRLGPTSVAAIDDCHPQGGAIFGKGTLAVPFAIEHGWKVTLEPTYPPYRTAVLTRD